MDFYFLNAFCTLVITVPQKEIDGFFNNKMRTFVLDCTSTNLDCFREIKWLLYKKSYYAQAFILQSSCFAEW